MPLRVSYKNPMGYVVVREAMNDINENGNLVRKVHTFKYDCCFANIQLFAEIEHTETEHRLHMFFYDNAHLARIFKAEGADFLKGRHYHFNSYFSCPNKTTVRMLTKLGAKVSFFYKDLSKKK